MSADGTGAFSQSDAPPGQGTNLYTASVNADGVHAAASATAAVLAQYPPGTLVVTAARPTLPYRGLVTVTVHLTAPASTPNRTISIMSEPRIGRWVFVTGTMNAHQSFSHTFELSRTALFLGAWSGDDLTGPTNATSSPVTVGSITHQTMRYFYRVLNHYRLYHYSQNCVQTHTQGCPNALATVIPNNPGGALCFISQEYVRGSWTETKTACTQLSSDSHAILHVFYFSRHIIGVPLRSRARFEGTDANLASSSHWQYFRVTG
jgi:hypothetical protein